MADGEIKVQVSVKKDEGVKKLEELMTKINEAKTLADELASLLEIKSK